MFLLFIKLFKSIKSFPLTSVRGPTISNGETESLGLGEGGVATLQDLWRHRKVVCCPQILMRWYSVKKYQSVKCFLKTHKRFGFMTLLQSEENRHSLIFLYRISPHQLSNYKCHASLTVFPVNIHPQLLHDSFSFWTPLHLTVKVRDSRETKMTVSFFKRKREAFFLHWQNW